MPKNLEVNINGRTFAFAALEKAAHLEAIFERFTWKTSSTRSSAALRPFGAGVGVGRRYEPSIY